MNTQHNACKKIRCSHLKEDKCSFHDCIFSTAEIVAKEHYIDSGKELDAMMKLCGAVALVLLIALYVASEVIV